MTDRKASRLAVREEFISWLLIPEKERVKLGLPRTVVAFAEAKGVGERTLRRWMNADEKFQAELEVRRSRLLTQTTPGALSGEVHVPGPALVKTVPQVSGIDSTFDYAWSKLQELIASGDKNALQMYLNSPLAKSVMEAQLEQRKSDFSELSDEELTVRILASVSTEDLRAELSRREPGDDGP